MTLIHIFQIVMTKPLSIFVLMIWVLTGTYILDVCIKMISKYYYYRKWKKIGEL
jgi:hypothetical protein